MVEEVKGGKQPMNERPKVSSMKATIVSMEYRNIRNNSFKQLNESNIDA